MPVWYSVPPLWGTCDLMPLAGLLYPDPVSCCFCFSEETRVFSLCESLSCWYLCWEQVFGVNILFHPNWSTFPYLCKKKPSLSWAKTPNPEVSPARSLNSDELFRWFLSQKNWNDRGSFLPVQVTHWGKLCPQVCRLRIPFLLFISSALPDTSTLEPCTALGGSSNRQVLTSGKISTSFWYHQNLACDFAFQLYVLLISKQRPLCLWFCLSSVCFASK